MKGLADSVHAYDAPKAIRSATALTIHFSFLYGSVTMLVQ